MLEYGCRDTVGRTNPARLDPVWLGMAGLRMVGPGSVWQRLGQENDSILLAFFISLRTLCRRCHVLRKDMRHRGMIASALRDGIIPPDWRGLVWE